MNGPVSLRSLLASGHVAPMDGAMSTELMRRGLALGDNAGLWNLDRAEDVAAVHRAYADAGAWMFLTNTFQIHPAALARHGREQELEAIATTALRLARAAAPHAFVLGDVGPMGAVSGDADFPSRDDLGRVVNALGDADGILLETCSDLRTCDAIRAVAELRPQLPVLASFTFRREDGGALTTFAGHTPEEIARAVSETPAAALGVNCGRDIDVPIMAEIVRRYRKATSLPILARPNAGTPTCVAGEWVYPRTPTAMADAVPALLAAGAALIGGCCGTTPAFIRACADVIAGVPR
jgi:5-methyltetrahydrofolate--homocysteine methyltransferase